MRKHLALLILAAVAFVAPAALAGKPTPPPPDYFPLAKGYWWKYESTTDGGNKSQFTVKVLGTEKQADGSEWWQVAIETPTMTIHDYYSKPKGWVLEHKQVYTSNNMVGEFKPVKQFLQNPLGKGAKWSWKGTGMMDTEISEDNVVAGGESVTVPAGKFGAMRVDTAVVQGGQNVKKTYWYADHVGMVKSMTESGGIKSTTVLLDYSFKKRP